MRLGLNCRGWGDPPVSRLENGSGAVGPRFHCLAASGDSPQGRENIGIDIAPRRHPLDRLGKCQKAWKLGFVGDAKGGVEFPHPVIDGSRARTSSIVISGIWLLTMLWHLLSICQCRILTFQRLSSSTEFSAGTPFFTYRNRFLALLNEAFLGNLAAFNVEERHHVISQKVPAPWTDAGDPGELCRIVWKSPIGSPHRHKDQEISPMLFRGQVKRVA